MKKQVTLDIKYLASPDVDVSKWVPNNRAEVWFLLEIEIGAENDDGCDLFQVIIATPEGLRSRSSRSSETVISERNTIVLSDYTYEIMQQAVRDIVKKCAAASWDEAVLKLQRFFHWEYEDYVLEDSEDP